MANSFSRFGPVPFCAFVLRNSLNPPEPGRPDYAAKHHVVAAPAYYHSYMMGDLFAHFLCGSSVAEYTNASTSQCMDPFTREWARPLLYWMGLSLFCVLTIPWYIAVQIATNGEFLSEAVRVDLGQKLVGVPNRSSGPVR
jgi:hypothetical protein